MEQLTHLDANGNARMVDVSQKADTARAATAVGSIKMNETAFAAVRDRTAKKGDVLAVAQIAGLQAVKRTAELIPLCHLLQLTGSTVTFELDEENRAVHVTCTTKCVGKTGVEMEALTGASVALLTVYDMCKALDRGMVISGVRLAEKSGGKSGHYRREEQP